jgi:mRNA-degrading endonuclease RelE of RelBE toxin-antitoxin system
MTYHIEFVSQAAKQFRTLPSQVQERLKAKIDALSNNPQNWQARMISTASEVVTIALSTPFKISIYLS